MHRTSLILKQYKANVPLARIAKSHKVSLHFVINTVHASYITLLAK